MDTMNPDLINIDVKSLSPEQKKELKKLKDREYARINMYKKYHANHEEELQKAKEKYKKKLEREGKPAYGKRGRPRKPILFNIIIQKGIAANDTPI